MTSERGQALVEFALVLPLLLALTFAIVGLTEIGVVRLALEHAAAEGARVGALTNDDRLIADTVAASAHPLAADAVTVEVVPRAGQGARAGDPRGALLTVRLRTVVRPLPFTFVAPLEIRASAARRIEWTR
ncbi:MAG TPA: TadE/TadG family type IV pilus assembly protein [Candidatus Limnocylindria bacterium]|nr:TadE/TadG family type IV pilus assembly protein [Candidatus Limnocylindria bacterium]